MTPATRSPFHLGRAGSKHFYDKGCRCDECRSAKLNYNRGQRARERAENRPSYVNELASARARKELYRGECRECGAPTTGCDGPGSARALCIGCSNRVKGLAKRGTGPRSAVALRLLSRPRTCGEIARQLDITPNHACVLLARLRQYGLVERVRRGVYQRVAV